MSGKFVYRIKTDSHGVLAKYKSRFVARGFMSREGIEHDADMVFSPVMSNDSMRSIFATAAGNGWVVRQTDVANAYLQGHLVDKDGNVKSHLREDWQAHLPEAQAPHLRAPAKRIPLLPGTSLSSSSKQVREVAHGPVHLYHYSLKVKDHGLHELGAWRSPTGCVSQSRRGHRR
mmetsp:Transcript_97940/g.280162  ORF Transcript_97940/g.280162 Transcript_97940/m.280162 type:complete len:174 (+) Transcript_97940:5375-5896(+)